MGIRYNIYKDKINHKNFVLGPHVLFPMESPCNNYFDCSLLLYCASTLKEQLSIKNKFEVQSCYTQAFLLIGQPNLKLEYFSFIFYIDFMSLK